MSDSTSKDDELQKFHPSRCDKFEVLRGIYPNNRRKTGKPCSCGFDELIKQYGIHERIEGRIESGLKLRKSMISTSPFVEEILNPYLTSQRQLLRSSALKDNQGGKVGNGL